MSHAYSYIPRAYIYIYPYGVWCDMPYILWIMSHTLKMHVHTYTHTHPTLVTDCYYSKEKKLQQLQSAMHISIKCPLFTNNLDHLLSWIHCSFVYPCTVGRVEMDRRCYIVLEMRLDLKCWLLWYKFTGICFLVWGTTWQLVTAFLPQKFLGSIYFLKAPTDAVTYHTLSMVNGCYHQPGGTRYCLCGLPVPGDPLFIPV